MTGSEKCPILTIGKYKKPRCFRGIFHLPTEYEATPKAWMTSQLFEAWLWKWDAKLTRNGRKIALFVGNCTAHPHIENLQSIELIFLPPNTTSEIQPCDQGIIKTLKTYYRKDMIKRLIGAINSGLTVNNFKITLLDSLQMLKKAWDSVTSTCIANCFRKAGFTAQPAGLQGDLDDPFLDLDDPSKDLDGDDPSNGDDPFEDLDDPFLDLHLDNLCSFEDYLSVDSGLQCAPLPNSEDIIASIRQTTEDAEESDDAGDPLSPVTYKQARLAFMEFQSFLLRSHKDTEPPYRLLCELETELLKAGNNACMQTSITDYFTN